MVTERQAAWDSRYGHLKANVPLRRTAYAWIIVLAALALAASFVDIVWLDEVLFWIVIGVYAALLLWGIFLLFSRKRTEELMEFQVADTMDLEREFLRCPECRHVFEFHMEHRHESHDVDFTCPECGFIGKLPPADRERVAAPVPGGVGEGPTFICNVCGEHWKVGTLGHDPKREVQFSACPHCGEDDDFDILEDDRPETPY